MRKLFGASFVVPESPVAAESIRRGVVFQACCLCREGAPHSGDRRAARRGESGNGGSAGKSRASFPALKRVPGRRHGNERDKNEKRNRQGTSPDVPLKRRGSAEKRCSDAVQDRMAERRCRFRTRRTTRQALLKACGVMRVFRFFGLPEGPVCGRNAGKSRGRFPEENGREKAREVQQGRFRTSMPQNAPPSTVCRERIEKRFCSS